MPLLTATLSRFLSAAVCVEPGDRLLVAFSGGPDSTALLWGLTQVARSFGIRLHAAHFDHRLDPDSERRAAAAAAAARRFGVALTSEPWLQNDRSDEASGLEARARAARYRFLERSAERLGARWIATAHHADDQAETVLLRLLFGSGLQGLAGIQPVRGRIVRPLLELRHADLVAALAAARVTGVVADPTNRDLARPRNRIRHHLLPLLERDDPGLRARLCGVAGAARDASRFLESWLGGQLGMRQEAPKSVSVERAVLEQLPEPLFAMALAIIQRAAGDWFPPALCVREELLRQLRERGGVGCDGAHGWRWEADRERVRLARRQDGAGILTEHFTYTVSVPGEVELPESRLRLRVRPAEVEGWMFRGRPSQAGLALDPGLHRRVVVRNRRSGDRVRMLGGPRRRLKDLLIEHRIPRQERDRLPLLVIDDEIAWVPGVTIGERFRLQPGMTHAWVAELEPLRA